MLNLQNLRDEVNILPRPAKLMLAAALVLVLAGVAWRLGRPAPVQVAGGFVQTSAEVSNGPARTPASHAASLVQQVPATPAANTARDPFALPPQYILATTAQAEQAPAPGVAAGITPHVPAPSLRDGASKYAATPAAYVLRGVVSGDNGRRAAIIEAAGGSCAYRVGEQVDTYRLVEVTMTQAVLDGPTGRLVLTLRR